MPTPQRKPFPRPLSEDASEAELRAFLADLLEWLPRQRLQTLLDAGVPAMTIFQMKRVARAYRQRRENPATHRELEQVIDSLGDLQMTLWHRMKHQ